MDIPTDLPPIFICGINNIQDITFSKRQTSFFTWNQSVHQWIIVEASLHKYLHSEKRSRFDGQVRNEEFTNINNGQRGKYDKHQVMHRFL